MAEKQPAVTNGLENKLIDYKGFVLDSEAAGKARAQRRITEAQFIEMAKDPNTIILDTRSASQFALLHVKGAKNLNFSDITKDTLARTIPTKETRILIYCNNNFDKEKKAFPAKRASMPLNIPTFITLHAYGYTNLYELGPLLDVNTTKIELTGMKIAQNNR